MQALVVVLAVFGIVAGDFGLRRSEDNEVAVCGNFDVCNIVYNPYWGSQKVEKICQCPKGFCPATFEDDNQSLAINVRTQMKFCQPVADLRMDLNDCGEDDDAINVRTIYYIDQVKNVSASLLCNDNHKGPIYWRFHSRLGKIVENDEKLFEIVDNFQSTGEGGIAKFPFESSSCFLPALPQCQENEFCGFARLDYGFVYQRCSCDPYHDCRFLVDSSEVEEDIESEIFYSGLMYKSRCLRNDKYED
jgi:protein giant-lens (argos)